MALIVSKLTMDTSIQRIHLNILFRVQLLKINSKAANLICLFIWLSVYIKKSPTRAIIFLYLNVDYMAQIIHEYMY